MSIALLAASCAGDRDDAAPVVVPPGSTTTEGTTDGSGDAQPATTTVPIPPTTATTTTAVGRPATTTSTVRLEVTEGWAVVTPDGEKPPVRANPVMAFDPSQQLLYLHGGRAGGRPLSDLWVFDPGAERWRQLEPTGDVPTARFAHAAVWDGQRQRFVIFSGQGQGAEFFSDVWAYDPDSNAWELLADGGAGPANRYGSCIGYDAAEERFLISHGFTDRGRFDDTWAFSLSELTWTDISPAGVRPVRRCLHTCSYDSATGTFVLFGGQSNEARFHDDTWILSGDAWSQVSSSGPAPRRFTAGWATAGSFQIFGGIGPDGATADLWRLDILNETWSEVEAETGPSPRDSHAVALEGSAGRLFVFGGKGPDGELDELWVLALQR